MRTQYGHTFIKNVIRIAGQLGGLYPPTVTKPTPWKLRASSKSQKARRARGRVKSYKKAGFEYLVETGINRYYKQV